MGVVVFYLIIYYYGCLDFSLNHEAQDIALIVEAKNVNKSRGGKTLFTDLSFALKLGQIFGVSGDNDCGKSTLGDMLFGLLPSDSDSID